MIRKHLHILLAVLAFGLLAGTSAGHAQQTVQKQKSSKMPATVAVPAAQPGLGDFDQFVAAQVKQWKLPGASIAVVQKGKIILVGGYGRPVYELVPGERTTFDIKGIPGFSVEFRKDETDAWTDLVLYQANGTLAAER